MIFDVTLQTGFSFEIVHTFFLLDFDIWIIFDTVLSSVCISHSPFPFHVYTLIVSSICSLSLFLSRQSSIRILKMYHFLDIVLRGELCILILYNSFVYNADSAWALRKRTEWNKEKRGAEWKKKRQKKKWGTESREHTDVGEKEREEN